jgi:hypothetical protein
MRMRDVVRCAKAQGARVSPPTGGSHWKLQLGGRSAVIPARSLKDDVLEHYVRSACKVLGMDYGAFR